jgi:hypothetical protein
MNKVNVYQHIIYALLTIKQITETKRRTRDYVYSYHITFEKFFFCSHIKDNFRNENINESISMIQKLFY